jgi:hypothetical protein
MRHVPANGTDPKMLPCGRLVEAAGTSRLVADGVAAAAEDARMVQLCARRRREIEL